jgi:hypothetical protein
VSSIIVKIEDMSKEKKTQVIIRSEQINYTLEKMLNNLLVLDFNHPMYRVEENNSEVDIVEK